METETQSTHLKRSSNWDSFVEGLEKLADEEELYGGFVHYESEEEEWPEEPDSELDIYELEKMVEDLEEGQNTQENTQVWLFTEEPEYEGEDSEDEDSEEPIPDAVIRYDHDQNFLEISERDGP